jgi:flagellar biosynthesis component FlhA
MLVGMDETQVLVDRVAADRPVLVRETLPKRVDLPTLTYILGRLVEEGVHLELVPEVLESVAKGPAVSDREALVERVRAGLAPFITTHLRAADDVLSIMVLDDETASLLETALVKGEDGAALALSTDDVGLIVRALRDAVTRYGARVLLARPHLRRALSDLLRAELPEVRVVKPSELDAMQRVRVACEISV